MLGSDVRIDVTAVFHLTITSETSAAIQRKAVKSRFVVSAKVMTDAYGRTSRRTTASESETV